MSPEEPFSLGFEGTAGRRLRLHASNPSKVLRSRARGTCGWCGNVVDWFDRFDGGRIPLTPMLFPSVRVPRRHQWSVDRGMAHLGATGDECRIPHPAICPALEHVGQDPELARMTQVLGVNTRKLIDTGKFTPPAAAPDDEDEIAQPEPENAAPDGSARHILYHGSVLKICPGRIEDLQCVADAESTRRRCENPVFDISEGGWTQVDIPPAAGRSGKAILLTYRGRMWAWEIQPLDYKDALRWFWQKCPMHHNAPEAHDRELIDFSTARHAPFILTERPPGYEAAQTTTAASGSATQPSEAGRTRCASDGCWNGTLVPVNDGWLCWQCAKRARTRETVRRKWQQNPQPSRELPTVLIPEQQNSEEAGDATALFLHDASQSESLVSEDFTGWDDSSPF
ncbi:DUF6083 domain-containing protein [Kitasatospora sp. NPDC096077]|uniref:DUF6083 domain-containing protein n=1 Tax=Kitasatospora sp. NPDC096077 TaxID=3155544 RepID=UPI0033336259